jgi:hypothetical protein
MLADAAPPTRDLHGWVSRISMSASSVTNPEDATGRSLGGLTLAFVNRQVPSVRRLQATDNSASYRPAPAG